MVRLIVGVVIALGLGVLVLQMADVRLFDRADNSGSRTSRPREQATGDRTDLGTSGCGNVVRPPAPEGIDEVDVGRLANELRAALREGDSSKARRAAEQLVLARKPAATDALIELLREGSLDVPSWLISLMRTSASEGARAPLAQAAWDRLQEVLARGSGDRAPRELYEIVVDHGSESALASLLKQVNHRRVGKRVTDALAVSQRPTAPDRFSKLFAAGHVHQRSARLFAETHGARAMELYEGTLARMVAGEPGPGRYRQKDLARLYGTAALPERLPEVRRVLDSLGGQPGFPAVYLVNRLHERGFDVSKYGDQLEAPVIELERIASGSVSKNQVSKRTYAALYAIEYNPIAWTARAVRALEDAARTIDPTHRSLAKDLIDRATRIRTTLESQK